MLYTSYFGNIRNLPEELAVVSISTIPIKGWSGYQYRKLAPKAEWISLAKNGGTEEYKRLYMEMLNCLDPDVVIEELYDLTDSEDIVLVCYERSENFCHRHIVSEWFRNAGYECEEFK